LDKEDPGWRTKLHKEMNAENPRGGWVAAAKVQTTDGEEVEVAILAHPSEVRPGPLDEGPMMAS
jgi:hypothetical protein